MCEREGWSKRPAIMSIHSQKQGYKAKNACGRPSVSVCVCVCVRYSNTRQVYDGLLLQLLLLLLSLLQAPPATLLLTRLSPAAGDAKRQTANGYMTTTCLHFVFCLPSSVCPVLMTKAAVLQVAQCVRSCLRACVCLLCVRL